MRKAGLLMLSIPIVAMLGCGPNISSVQMGAVYPPQPDGCKVAIANIDYQQALTSYEQLGLITVAGGDVTDKVRDQVRRKACRMGGDTLSLNGAVDTGSRAVGNMTQFLVLRKKAEATAAAPPQTGI
jgi:hypothetical protein